jgi:hypothetical protein
MSWDNRSTQGVGFLPLAGGMPGPSAAPVATQVAESFAATLFRPSFFAR